MADEIASIRPGDGEAPTRDLTPAERRVLHAMGSGQVDEDLRPDGSEADDVGRSAEWGSERQLRGSVLARWLLAPEGAPPIRLRWFRVRGARITGTLDLEASVLPCPLALVGCSFESRLRLREASAPSLRLNGSRLPGLDARQLTTRGDLELSGGFEADGEVDLRAARIGGDMVCDGGKFRNAGGRALNGDGLRVGGDMSLRTGFEADGEVGLRGAHVGGQLYGAGGTFRNAGGRALYGDGLQVDGDVFLRSGFEAVGEVNLMGARIGSWLDCDGGKFRNPTGSALHSHGLRVEGNMFLRNGFEAEGVVDMSGSHIGGNLECNGGKFRNPNGRALNCGRVRVEGSLFLRNGFEADGEVNLISARVGSNLECNGGKFRNPDGRALNGSGVSVGGNMFLRDGFEADGEVQLLNTQIGGQLSCSGATFRNPNRRALSASMLQVEGDVFLSSGFEANGEISLLAAHVGGQLSCRQGTFRNPGRLALDLERAEITHLLMQPAAFDGGLDLTNARVRHYQDARASWPARGGLGLVGFTYETIDASPPVTRRERLDWLRLDASGYSPQPYDQLAAACRRAGEEEDAVRVAIEKRRRRRSRLPMPGRALDLVMDGLVVYGYRARRAFVWLAILLATAWLTLSIAHAYKLVTPADKVQPSDFNALAYSVDWVVPVLNLHQRDAWVTHGWAQWLTLGFASAGWILTTAVVLGLSGVLKRD